jgi:16S rRNA (uracil1498-N3)-methyltransferase
VLDRICGNRISVTGADLHHLRVRRLAAGDAVLCFDDAGAEYRGAIRRISARAAEIEIEAVSRPPRESPLRLTLALAALKGDHLALAVEKATELGVAEVVVFECERTVARPSPARMARLQRIAVAAAKQSGRVQVPEIRGPVAFPETLSPPAILFQPTAERRLARGLGDFARLTAIVGPEGGFSAAEIGRAEEAGCRVVGLGPRVLRAETAAIAICCLCHFLWGDLASLAAAH